MLTTEVLKPFFQKRYVCAQHGYFDIMLASKPAESFCPKCPVCGEKSFPRDGYECTGKTSRDLPYISKPRLEEYVEFEFPELGTKGFRQVKKKSRERRGVAVK